MHFQCGNPPCTSVRLFLRTASRQRDGLTIGGLTKYDTIVAKLSLTVTKKSVSKDSGKELVTVRLLVAGRSMWLNMDSVSTGKLTNKDTVLEVEDTEFNPDKFEVLKCSNEKGQYLKLVPKTGFKLAEF